MDDENGSASKGLPEVQTENLEQTKNQTSIGERMDKRAETIEAAREFLESHWGVTQPQAVTQAISIVMADFHLSQSRDAWTPVETPPSEKGRYLVRDRMNNPKDCVHIAYWSVNGQMWMNPTNEATNKAANENITHWMPIPPYEQEK
jgi:hypothetical protein